MQPDIRMHTSSVLHAGRNHKPAFCRMESGDTGSLAKRPTIKRKVLNTYGQAFQTCPTVGESTDYLHSYSPGALHLASIRVLKTRPCARCSPARHSGSRSLYQKSSPGCRKKAGRAAMTTQYLWPVGLRVVKGAQTISILPILVTGIILNNNNKNSFILIFREMLD